MVPNYVVNHLEDVIVYHLYDFHLIQQHILYQYHYEHRNDNALKENNIYFNINRINILTKISFSTAVGISDTPGV